MMPGRSLRGVAASLLGEAVITRLVEPTLLDARVEQRRALDDGNVFAARLAHVRGYWAVAAAVTVYLAERFCHIWDEASGRERHTLVRSLGIGVAGVTAVTAVLISPYVLQSRAPVPIGAAVYLIPSALVIATPAGALIAVLFGMRHALTPRLRVMTLLLAAAGSAVSLVGAGWLVPQAANQAYRNAAFRAAFGPGTTQRPFKGVRELTLDELKTERSFAQATGSSLHGASRALEYHRRWAIAGTTLTAAIFALIVISVSTRTATLFGAALTAVLTWYGFFAWGSVLARAGVLSPPAGAWSGNLALLTFALGMWALFGRKRQRLSLSVPGR